jgi:hypothetical protein
MLNGKGADLPNEAGDRSNMQSDNVNNNAAADDTVSPHIEDDALQAQMDKQLQLKSVKDMQANSIKQLKRFASEPF